MSATVKLVYSIQSYVIKLINECDVYVLNAILLFSVSVIVKLAYSIQPSLNWLSVSVTVILVYSIQSYVIKFCKGNKKLLNILISLNLFRVETMCSTFFFIQEKDLELNIILNLMALLLIVFKFIALNVKHTYNKRKQLTDFIRFYSEYASTCQ